MPRKPKFTREEVLDSAFEVARESGVEAVTAAGVAANMGYTGSSLFTHFDSMEEIRAEVYGRAKAMVMEYFLGCMEYQPAFKEMGLRWVRFAKEEPQLYRMLFLGKEKNILKEFDKVLNPMKKEVQKEFGLSGEDAAELISGCITQANGISAFIINGSGDYTDEEIGRYLSNTCLGMVLLFKTRDGSMTPQMASAMANATGQMPIPR